VEIGGAAMRRIDTRRLQEQGVAVIPPDRQRQGLALGLSVRDNLVLGLARTPAFHSGPLLNRGKLRGVASKLATDHDVRSADLGQSARSLSGGNQQKIVIARALAEHPKLIIAASPTRGLDVAATAYVHESLRACRKLGVAVLLISTELEEILALSDRIAVMYEGRIVGIVGPDEPREKIGIMMGGSA
jgi:simple sugar transport system ATP-binding protein